MLDASKQSSQVKHIFQHQSMSKTANSPSISRSFFSSQVSSSKIRRAWILGCDAMEALHIDYMWCWVLHLGMCHKHLSMAVHWYGMYIFVYIQCSTPSTYNSLQIYSRCLWFSTFLYMFLSSKSTSILWSPTIHSEFLGPARPIEQCILESYHQEAAGVWWPNLKRWCGGNHWTASRTTTKLGIEWKSNGYRDTL